MRNSFVQHVPVPRDVAGWIRKFDRHKKLNDEVENVHGSLSWSDKAEEYFRLLDAMHRSQQLSCRRSAHVHEASGPPEIIGSDRTFDNYGAEPDDHQARIKH